MSAMSSFFRRYADAYLTLDPKGLDAFFALPCMIIDNQGDHIIGSEKDLFRYEKSFVETLKTSGLQNIEPTIIAERAMDRSSHLCSVRYRVQDRHQETFGDVDYHYILIMGDVDWRIKFAKMGTVHH